MVDGLPLIQVGLWDHTNWRTDKLYITRSCNETETAFLQASLDLVAKVLNVVQIHGQVVDFKPCVVMQGAIVAKLDSMLKGALQLTGKGLVWVVVQELRPVPQLKRTSHCWNISSIKDGPFT